MDGEESLLETKEKKKTKVKEKPWHRVHLSDKRKSTFVLNDLDIEQTPERKKREGKKRDEQNNIMLLYKEGKNS